MYACVCGCVLCCLSVCKTAPSARGQTRGFVFIYFTAHHIPTSLGSGWNHRSSTEVTTKCRKRANSQIQTHCLLPNAGTHFTHIPLIVRHDCNQVVTFTRRQATVHCYRCTFAVLHFGSVSPFLPHTQKTFPYIMLAQSVLVPLPESAQYRGPFPARAKGKKQ